MQLPDSDCCFSTVVLPVIHERYEEFKSKMEAAITCQPGCIPRPFRRRNPAESHLSISSRQGFWRRNLVHCAVAAVGGASDHKFNKHDGMEAVVFFTLLFSVLFLGLSPESVITLCSFSLSSTPPNWHWRQILLCRHPWRKYPAERKNGMHYGVPVPRNREILGCYDLWYTVDALTIQAE